MPRYPGIAFMPLTDAELLQRFEGATLVVTSTVRNQAGSKVYHSGSTSICVLAPPKG